MDIVKQTTADAVWGKRVHLVAMAMAVVFLAMLLPAFYYSMHTPFALVDDIGDFTSVNLLKSSRNFHSWVDATFVGVSQGGRYRPLFDIHNATAWLIIGPHAVGHHLVRWVEWLAGILFWNIALWRMVRTRCYGVARGTRRTKALIPLLIFNAFVCFFPNQPLARLAPQELHTFCALGMLFMGTTRLLTDPETAGRAEVVRRTLMIVAGYVGLSLAKEVNVALMAMFCLFLCGVSLARRRGPLLVAVVPAVGLLAYTIWRIHVASVVTNYGRIEFGIPLLAQNIRWLTNDAFQWATVPVFSVLLVLSVLMTGVRCWTQLKQWGVSLEVECMTFSLGMTLSMCAILMIAWLPVLRYFYPLVPLLGWHLAGAFMEWDRSWNGWPGRKALLSVVTLVLLGWFVLANYFGFLVQFAVQHNARRIEQRLLSTMEQRLKAGRPVAICCDRQDPEIELASAVKVYFENYLPLYRGERLGLRILPSLPSDTPVELVSRRRLEPDQWRLVETITNERQDDVFTMARRVSALAQGKRYPYVVQDAGTHGFDYAWYLYEPVAFRAVR